MSQVNDFLTALPGHIPLSIAVIFWLAAVAGLMLMARQGHWRLALLITIAAMAPWLGFFSITKSHFWAPRYAFTGILFLSVGLGALLAHLWNGQLIAKRIAGQILAVLVLLASVLLAGPYLREIFLVPKMELRKAFGVIKEHGRDGEVIMLFPDYYISVNSYKPYRYNQNASIIRGPKGTWADAGLSFVDTFDHLYADGKPEDATPPVTLAKKLPKPPQAAWVFMLRPETSAEPGKRWASRLVEVEPVLAAYGLNIANLLDILKDDPFTLTFRISRDENGQGRIDHVTPTVGRRFR